MRGAKPRRPTAIEAARDEQLRRERMRWERLSPLFALPPFADPRIKGDFRLWEGVFAALQRGDDGSAHVSAMMLLRIVEQLVAEYGAEPTIEALQNLADDMIEALKESIPSEVEPSA